jgi:hypothetical protein
MPTLKSKRSRGRILKKAQFPSSKSGTKTFRNLHVMFMKFMQCPQHLLHKGKIHALFGNRTQHLWGNSLGGCVNHCTRLHQLGREELGDNDDYSRSFRFLFPANVLLVPASSLRDKKDVDDDDVDDAIYARRRFSIL